MEPTLTECPNCSTSLKHGFFASVTLLEPEKVRLINAINNTDKPGYCTKCGDNLLGDAQAKLTRQLSEVRESLLMNLKYIPVVSAQSPQGWEYDTLDMVTGQSTTGTGVYSEFASSWKDLLGGQSNTYNRKLKEGENLCFTQLRRDALNMGANAVIATDIDYSEVGGDKGMLMVCMAGTAVKVKNVAVFGPARAEKMAEINQLYERLISLERLKMGH